MWRVVDDVVGAVITAAVVAVVAFVVVCIVDELRCKRRRRSTRPMSQSEFDAAVADAYDARVALHTATRRH